MRIREAVLSDRDAIVEFDRVARLDAARIRLIDRLLNEATCLVLENEKRVVAYGALEYSFYDNGFIPMLYVAEPERRSGIGRALLNGLISRCTTRKIFTSTNQSNEAMRALLTAVGFQQSGIIENLDPGDPEIVYFLDGENRSV